VALTIRIVSISSMITPFQGYLVVAPNRKTIRHLNNFIYPFGVILLWISFISNLRLVVDIIKTGVVVV